MEHVEAHEQFDAARFKAFRRAVRKSLTRRERWLMALEHVLQAAGQEGRSEAGVREIPLARIVGSASENKIRDFDRAFLPRSRRLRDRWARMYAAVIGGAELPPIDVYRIGDDYYVSDGHHRVSVFRQLGRETIKARVTDVRTRAPLPPGVDPAELLRTAEYARFLEATELDRVRPQARLEVSRLGRFEELLRHVLGHAYFLGLERAGPVPIQEAAASWYDTVYLPIAAAIRRHAIAEEIPGVTETDIYLEITRRWLELGEAGADTGPDQAAHAILEDLRQWRRRRRPLSLG